MKGHARTAEPIEPLDVCPDCDGEDMVREELRDRFVYGVHEKVEIEADITVSRCRSCGAMFAGDDASMARDAAVRQYLSRLRYPVEVHRDEDGDVVALHPDLPGCAAQGETVQAALAGLAEARDLWIGTMLEDACPVPEPASEGRE